MILASIAMTAFVPVVAIVVKTGEVRVAGCVFWKGAGTAAATITGSKIAALGTHKAGIVDETVALAETLVVPITATGTFVEAAGNCVGEKMVTAETPTLLFTVTVAGTGTAAFVVVGAETMVLVHLRIVVLVAWIAEIVATTDFE